MTNGPICERASRVLLSPSRRCPELVEKERFAIGGPVLIREIVIDEKREMKWQLKY
jgi:hypothetical protein